MKTPFEPPYYAVIFISTVGEDSEGYSETAQRMVELAQTMPGFLGIESAREERGISVSFWQDEASIQHWKQQTEHLAAQKMGIQRWYDSYQLHVAKVERYYDFQR